MKKTVRILLITIASLMALGALFFVVVAWPGSTKKIERIADQFQPDESWQLQSETINPPRILCLMADCGEVHRSWHKQNYEIRSCREVLAVIGADAEKIYEESVSERREGVVRYCEVRIEREGEPVVITYYNFDDSRNDSKLTVRVE